MNILTFLKAKKDTYAVVGRREPFKLNVQQESVQNIVKSKRNFAWAAMVIILMVVMMACAINGAVAEQEPYADYKAFAKYETSTVEDLDKVGELCNLLPMLNNYHNRWFALDTLYEPPALQIYYDHFDYDKSWIPYHQFINDSNALLLFRYIHNLDRINLNYYSSNKDIESVPVEQREYKMHESYQRASFASKYGDLAQLTVADLEAIFHEERAIDDSAHYNRVRWGSSLEWVTYRNGDPDQMEELADGSVKWDYFTLGSTEGTVSFYINHPACVANGLDGVCRIYVSGWESEISWHCDITSASQQEMLDTLGQPQRCIREQSGITRYLYPVYGEKGEKYIYFDCLKEQIIAHGLGYGLSFDEE